MYIMHMYIYLNEGNIIECNAKVPGTNGMER